MLPLNLPVDVSAGVLCVDVSEEAELLVAGSCDGVVAVWSLADQQLTHTLMGHTGESVLVKENSKVIMSWVLFLNVIPGF